MENKKIIIAGGTGFIGQGICNFFGDTNELVILTRQLPDQSNNTFGEQHIRPEIIRKIRYVQWDGATAGDWAKEIEGADMIINLAGRSVNCRYTPQNMQEISDSRTRSVNAIGQAIRQAVHPPKLWINAASATIYPHATDSFRDENFTDFADDFSVQVCKQWEKTFYEHRTPFTRKVALRMAITLGAGGVMIPYFNLLKFGLGGRQGSGKQMYSWVHINDTCRMIEWIAEHSDMEGIYNCVSPNAVTNETFMQSLRKATGSRFGLPAPEWMLRLGARLIGTELELVLKSRWVLPRRILQSGFTFEYPLLEDAFAEIIRQTPRSRYQLF